MSAWAHTLRSWFPLAIAICSLTLLVYAGVQQDYRQSANDPQIQWAHDSADALTTGTSINMVVPTQVVDATKSLSTFIILTDENGKVLASSGRLDGTVPLPPFSAIEQAKKQADNRFTWETATGERFAAVVVFYDGKTSGYVLVARSLKEVEKRESALGVMVGLDLLGSLVFTFLIAYLLNLKTPTTKN